MSTTALTNLAAKLGQELLGDILPFWHHYRDLECGGYAGEIYNDGTHNMLAPKGLVMHARLLWTYSQAIIDGFADSMDREGHSVSHRDAARQALAFIRTSLADIDNGGFHWFCPGATKSSSTGESSTETSNAHLSEVKIVYGQAFAIYALSTWYRASGDVDALDLAVATFQLMEKVARDPEFGGYWEGVMPDWSAPRASSLGEEDPLVEKSMNTNLHVMEAWTSLHLALKTAEKHLRGLKFEAAGPGETELLVGAVAQLPRLKQSLSSIIDVHVDKIRVRPGHLGLFFNRDWSGEHPVESYGHDVEASWLIAEAAEELWGEHIPGKVLSFVTELAEEGARIIDLYSGSMPNEAHGTKVDEGRIWWVQAESMVAMVNLWQLTGNDKHIDRALAVWNYIRVNIIDQENGEWFWGRNADGSLMQGRQKGGMWKANYHNGRACMEIIRRAKAAVQKSPVSIHA